MRQFKWSGIIIVDSNVQDRVFSEINNVRLSAHMSILLLLKAETDTNQIPPPRVSLITVGAPLWCFAKTALATWLPLMDYKL